MKVGIIRGNNLNKFEMQSYEPLVDRYDLTGYASLNNNFDTGDIKFAVRRLHITEEYYHRAPWPLNSIAYGALLPFGLNYHMIGLEKELADKDILHTAETYNGYSYQAAKVRNERKKKLVVTVWENVPFLSIRSFPVTGNNERIVRYVRESGDIFIAVTERAKMSLMIEGVPEEKIRVIPAGVDNEVFRPSPPDETLMNRLGLDREGFALLFVGRLTREKGIYDLIYAMKLLSLDPAADRVKVIIAGNGPERDRIANTVRRLGLQDRVVLAGNFSYGQMPSLYSVADAFILPSIPVSFWQEQFGMVLVEAMASGLPVISTLSGSIPEVVGDAGLLVQPADPASIRDAIKRLVDDEDDRKKIGMKARDRAVTHFSTDRIYPMLDSVYRELEHA